MQNSKTIKNGDSWKRLRFGYDTKMPARIFILTLWTTLLPLLTAPSVHHYRTTGEDSFVNYYHLNNQAVGLFPRIFNLVKYSNISVNGTCGSARPEVFCRRPADKEARKANQCIPTLCDPKRHGIKKVLDGSKDSWISPTLENGLEYEYITITVDLKQIYQVSYITVKAGLAPLPAAWILERSLDGTTFTPWQYFAENEAECHRRYGMPATQQKPHYKTDDEVICLTSYSKLYRIYNSEIQISLINGRPSSNVTSEILRNFTVARYVRFRLQKMYKTEKDLLLRKKLFYSIKTIIIGGQCLCHGHASKCIPNKITGLPTCECEHNTCGQHCTECCPMYNQIPWSSGTLESAAECERCECHGHADFCVYNSEIEASKLSLDVNGYYRGGGQCINCKNHTTGVNCEVCEKGWYRPAGAEPDDFSPCLPCECHPLGSTGSCAQAENQEGKSVGSCECKKGYTGEKCDECAPGYGNFPNCEPCPCDSRGSILTDTCSVPCSCKTNVEGENCDRCLPGFFGLSANNPDGCIKCYCSGVVETCSEANVTRVEIESPLEDWTVTDLSNSKSIPPTYDPDTRASYIGNYELPGVESYYWLAPSKLYGSQVHLYGASALTFTVGWEAMRGDTSGQPTIGPNVIIVGNNEVKLGFGEEVFEGRKGNVTIKINLVEDGWYIIPPEVKDIRTRLRRTEYRGATITREQFLSVLANLKNIMLRAKFHTDQVEGSLFSVKIEPSTEGNTSSHFTEKCLCPPQYEGLSCESCAFSHFKLSNSTFDSPFQCLPCSCNYHSECDPETGICLNCEHNTQGENCATCKNGYYGNATLGFIDDCKPCACPLIEKSNNFSPTCELVADDFNYTETTQYFCTACPTGYIGDYCEMCDEAFYGNPLEIGNNCQPCNCNGGPCDNTTGECQECSGNTEGIRCENCKPFHYNNTNSTGCSPCECDAQGSESESCDLNTGQCTCKVEYTGRTCNQCEKGYGYFEGVCEKCKCGLGAKSEICESSTGECECQPGTVSPKCDDCEPLHYNLSAEGCSGCGCHPLGSENSACDIVTGQCHCKVNVTGRICDLCLADHWGIFSGHGCRPCDCDLLGSLSSSCDTETGQCVCKPGVGGLKCDSCLPNHYGFSINGCYRCKECKLLGHVCDVETGRCVCPPYTQGVHCQSCTPNAWGYQILKGCTPCNCDSGGSSSGQCDDNTGICKCRKGFRGTRCDACDFGFYNFPICKSCDCNFAGTKNETCDPNTGRCECDENGMCQCKANVIGKKCNVCKNGTFGIQEDNVNGCTACFCFGRSASCTQAGLHWSQIREGRSRTLYVQYDPSSSFKNTLPINSQEICYINLAMPGSEEISLNGLENGLNVTSNLRIIPGDTEDVKVGVNFLFDTPVYWRLPRQFLGDKVLSYSGYLKFLVETEGGNTIFPPTVLSTYPLVQLQGNSKIILQHFPLLPSKKGRYEIRFHESLWQDKHQPNRKVSRETLMVALQNVQHILIRASESVDFTKAVLSEVSLDTAAASNGLALAGGVELCECPPEYNSTSCQDPSIGFYRWYNKDVNTATILIQLIGEARPCECNNRSETCDIETGFCQNCESNTGGPHCEKCKEGFYGDPFLGPCLSCPCPKPERNFAVACHLPSGGDPPICTCKKGYTGKFCDRCAYGWYGYPEKSGGFCQPCNCNIYGSVSDECDEKTGQCNCNVGIEGRDCTICPKKTVLTSKGCSSCENGCTGILLKDFDNLANSIEGKFKSELENAKPPWESLKNIEKKIEDLHGAIEKWEETAKIFENLVDSNAPNELKSDTKDLVQKAYLIEGRAKIAKNDAAFLREETENALRKVYDIKDDIDKTIQNLKVYSEGKGRAISDAMAFKDAKLLLEEIKNRHLEPQRLQAEQILDDCTAILNKTMYMNERFPEIWYMKEQLKALYGKLQDLENYIKKTIDVSEKKLYQTEENKDRIKHLKRRLEDFNFNMREIDKIRGEADTLLYNADSYLTEVNGNIKNLTTLKPRLDNVTEILKMREGILQNLNPLYRNKYVKPAQMHAAHLMKKAKEYKDLLNTTNKDANLAVDAIKRYQEIVDDLETAKKAAQEALDSELMYKIFPPEFDESVLEKSEILKALSTRLKIKGTSQGQKNLDLWKKLEQEKKAIDNVENTIRNTGIADNKLSSEIGVLENNDVKLQVQSALDKVESLEKSLDKANEKVQMIRNDVLNKIRPQMINLNKKGGLQHLDKAHKEIQESLNLNRRISELLNLMNKTSEEQLKKPSMLHMSNTLDKLKNKITQARHAAQSIQLSLSSSSAKGCVRSFKVPNLEATTTARLVISITLDPVLENKIIFFLPSSTTSDFMAVEVIDGYVRFVWDNGGGPGVISKSLLEETKLIGPQWFKIVIERVSHSAKLWVYTKDSSMTTPAVNSSNPNFGRFDIAPHDRIWAGGLPPDYDKPSEILSLQQGLPGCLHSLILDDRPIGLWNYFTDMTDSCTACEKGVDDLGDGSSYFFNGKGYAVLKHAPKSTFNRYQFSIAMKFKTYDDNAILFLAISADKTRYALLTLRDGRVVFQIGYGGESQLEMSSTKKYNDGNWTIIEASRNFDRRRIIEKGLLKVEDEMKEAAPPTPPKQSQIPELATADYLVGGFPPGYNFSALNLRLPKPFLGCLSEIFIDKDIYNPLKGRTNGVGSSCSDKVIKVAGFHGNGYMKLDAVRLKKDSSFGLALRTFQPNALVLLANGMVQKLGDAKDLENEISNEIEIKLAGETKRKESYYSVSLVDGRIEARVDAGKGAITLVSQTMCNDGRFHSISVNKMGRKLELRVDDELQSSSTLPAGAIVVKVKDLYVGGVSDNIDASIYASNVTPFVGTIKDLLFTNELQPFDKPIVSFNVDIGRFGPENVDETMTFSSTTKLPPQNHVQCYRPRKYALDPRAAKLGDSLNSFIQVNLRRRGTFQKNFSLELNFRTFYPNGLLFMIPGTNKSGKQKNFLLSNLKNGQLQVVLKVKRKLEIMSEAKFNNGSWHCVRINREERKLVIRLNEAEIMRMKLPKRVNLSSTIYVGGGPDNRIMDPFVSKLQGYTGCVKNLKINNQTEDLIGDKSIHQGVGQCFPHIERGSYFSGDAYVAYKADFDIQSLLNIEIEFRTSEMNGILLSFSDFIGQPALSLEINNGKVIFLGDLDSKIKFRLVYEFVSKYVVCDNKWHRIHIMLDNDNIIMKVDQADVKLELTPGNFLNYIVSAPIYIGGLPENFSGGKPILETRDNFKGCMRSIVLGNLNIDFTSISMRHNVLIGSCPANHYH